MAIPGIHKEMTPEVANLAVLIFRQCKSLNHTVFLLNYEYAIDDIAKAIVSYVEQLEARLGIPMPVQPAYCTEHNRTFPCVGCTVIRTGRHDPGNASCPRNADPRNECCDC